MIQTFCFKCNNSLETVRSRELGLGPDCEINVKLAFDADIAAGRIVSGNVIFELLGVFAGDNAIPAAKEIALALINASPEKKLTWPVMAGFFSLARTVREHGDEISVDRLFKALAEVAPGTTAMLRGEASASEALLDYDPEAKQVLLAATTVRIASEALSKLASVKRNGTRMWTFDVRDAEAVYKITELRWPLIKVTQAFMDGLDICKNLPALPPPPAQFETSLATEYINVFYEVKDDKGQWLKTPTYDARQAMFLWLQSLGGCYNKKLSVGKVCAFVVPAEYRDEITARLTAMYPPRQQFVAKAPRATRARRASVSA